MSVAPLFRDRHAGGVALAEALAAYARGPQVVVLGMARGGVAVAAPVAPVAHALDGPLDTFIARKLVVPGLEEVAFGANAEGAARPCSTMSMTTSGFRGASRHPGWRTNAPRSSGASSGIGMAGRCAGWRGARSSWSTTESPAARRSGPPRARFVDTGRPNASQRFRSRRTMGCARWPPTSMRYLRCDAAGVRDGLRLVRRLRPGG